MQHHTHKYDFFFRFLLLHTLAQGNRIELVLFQPILAAYPARHSWIISAHINLGTLHKPMHMFNRQKNIICEMIFKLQNHRDDEKEPLQPLQVELDNLHTSLWHTNPYSHPPEACCRRNHRLMENPYHHQDRRNKAFYPSLVQH